jgi:hypothetical protein
MNERITKIVIDTLGKEGVVNIFGHWALSDEEMEKFAELIVLECLDIVANADMTGSWITHPKDVLYVACDQVKNHFGVQE